MNNPLSDGNESVVDIFVLGRSETGTLQLTEQLENQEYRVTLFTEGTELIDSLRLGKPNLIICDTTSYGQQAYDCCRQIKSDDNHWMIPVMILTRASSLGDLLYVLDCNGDNFIAKPYDSAYLLSMIEGLLLTPVEHQTTDQIKTQFKIQHEDQVFVVTADRRKLLEFLLSAFEIAVKNSEDLSSANNEIQILSSRLTILENTGIENARLIEMLNESVKKKEQDERRLKEESEEIEQDLDEKNAELGHLLLEFEETKKLLATSEEHIRILLEDREKTAITYQSENTELSDEVSSLSQKIQEKTKLLDTKIKELDAKTLALAEETTLSAKLDLAVKESDVQIEKIKRSLQALTVENEQLASALSAEKNRAVVAEEGMQSVIQAKAQSEQELTNLLNEQKDVARQQNDEIFRLKSGLEAECMRCRSTETQLESIRNELDQLRATYDAEKLSQGQQFNDLQIRFDSAVATMFSQERELKILKDELLVACANEKKSAESAASVTAAFNETRVEIEEREWKVQSLEKQIADFGILKEKNDETVRTLTTSLERVQLALNAEKEQHAAAEKQLNEAIRKRDENLQSVRGEHDQTKSDLDVHRNDILRLNRDLEAASLLRSTLQGDIAAASSRIKELEFELKSAVQVKDQNLEQVRSLAEELGAIKSELKEARSALNREKEQRSAVEDQFNVAVRVRDDDLQSIRGAHDQTKSDLEVHRNDLTRLNQDLEAATQLTSVLLADFNAASSRIAELEHELNSVIQGKEQTGQQARSLADDLDRTKAELETERRIRRTAEVNLQNTAQVSTRLKGDIDRSKAERDGLKAALEQEKLLHTAATEEARAAISAKKHVEDEFKKVKEEHKLHKDLSTAKIQKITGDFEQVLARQRELEQKVNTLEKEKASAEARAESLSSEIEQARTALADEWEDHMNDEERLAATEKKVSDMKKSLSGTEKAISEQERKWAVVVKQTDLPSEIQPAPKSIVVTKPMVIQAEPVIPDPHQKGVRFSGIEDLFEDDTQTGTITKKPDVPDCPVTKLQSDNRGVITDEKPAEKLEMPDEQDTEKPEDSEDIDEPEKSDDATKPDDNKDIDEPEKSDDAAEHEYAGDKIKTLDDFVTSPSSYGISFNRQQWFDLLKWSHHSGVLSQEQRMQIIRMGRLIQNGRKLTKKQDEQVREMIVLVQTLGYKFH